ncbi:substrate-binding domain-containing protein [Cohnella sp. AR92]|uniref:substrate-binding domain-containing protein n=1 Tax=Cohnella sp. AR92 TaxID=648716 RepID=UPI000F8F2EA3|nr:substrate-binding domain-containing protein [Cohnella sp. AR92]RUS43546.1 LacI family transcriptional regulator [Cohnella sp. AR92]
MIASRLRTILGAVAAVIALVLLGQYLIGKLAKPERIDIQVIIKSTDKNIEFWQVMKDGIEVATNEFGPSVEVTGSRSDADIDGQIALVEQAIEKKPDAIILAANDINRLVPAVEEGAKRGIRFFIVDSGINSDIAESVIATDNIKAGQAAGMEMLRHLDGPGKIAIINYVQTAASLIDRERGVRLMLEGRKDIELMDTFNAAGSETNAYQMAKQVLEDNPDVRGIIGLNEPTTVGAARAIKEMGRQGQVKLIGFDSSVNEIKLLEEEAMQATVIQKPFQMGYLSIKTAVEAFQDKKVPKVIDTGSLVITKQNMYDEENQKLLFPFYDK